MIKGTFLSLAVLAMTTTFTHAGSVDVFLSAPFTQTGTTSGAPDVNGNFTPGYTNAVTENFDSSDSPVGTYSNLTSTQLSYNTTTGQPITPQATFSSPGTFAVRSNDQYGGGGQGNYLAVSGSGVTTLTLSAPIGYLGLEWCAVDGGNSLTLYDQFNNVIGTFNAQTFTNLLGSNSTITAINGSVYSTSDYKGQPTGTSSTSSRANNIEYYSYLNFIAGTGTLISKIVLSEGSSADFESDNYSVLTDAPNAPLGTFVPLTTVPEPSTWMFFTVAGGLLLLFVMRRRRTA